MNWLLPLREYLVEVWNAALFGQLKTRDGNFNSDGVTQAVQSKWFWSFLEMCSVVMSVMAELGSWAEDCPCHSWHVKHLKTSKHRKSEVPRRFLKLLHGKNKLLPGDACGMWSFCPNRGKRAAEMACGKVIAVCMALFDKAMGTVVAFCNGLSAVDMQSVVDCFFTIPIDTGNKHHPQDAILGNIALEIRWSLSLGQRCSSSMCKGVHE